jgi:hypothetical protein
MPLFLVTLLVLGSLLLSGCMDVAQWQLRTFYGIDCRPEKLQHGQCVPVKKGSPDSKGDSNAQAARP